MSDLTKLGLSGRRVHVDPTTSWYWQWRVGRLQLNFRLLRHVYREAPDRWVLQPSAVWDRKR